MTVIRHITLDANNPYELGRFWEAVLTWPMGPECAPGDGEVLLEGPETTRDEELARVLALGAKVVEYHRKADDAGWVWCEDPEGNAGRHITRTALPTCGPGPPERKSRHEHHRGYTYPPGSAGYPRPVSSSGPASAPLSGLASRSSPRNPSPLRPSSGTAGSTPRAKTGP